MKPVSLIKEQLRNFVSEQLAGMKNGHIQDEDNLIESGIIDSLGILQLVKYIEAVFCMKVRDEDIVPENFESIALISAYIENGANGGPYA